MQEKVAIMLLISAFMLVVSYCIRRSLRKAQQYTKVEGTVKKALESEGRNVRYMIEFEENGQYHLAESQYYSSSTKQLGTGERVSIGYYMVGKSYRAIILDDRVVSVDTGAREFSNLLAIIGICFLLLAVLQALK